MFKCFNTFAPIVYMAFGFKWVQDRYCMKRVTCDKPMMAASFAPTPAPTTVQCTAAPTVAMGGAKLGCIDALTEQLQVLFVSKAAASFVKECLIPWLKLRKTRIKARVHVHVFHPSRHLS